MGLVLLAVVAVLVPLVALVLEHVGNVRISERHHSHHDTYVVPVAFTRALVLAMVFAGVFGLALAGLCALRVFLVDPVWVLVFFDAFVVSGFAMWWCLGRYKVSTFEECLAVTPLLGPDVWVRYEEIERLEWIGFRKGSGYRNLGIWAGGRRVATLSGIVDVEQILMRIDRFDVLPHPL